MDLVDSQIPTPPVDITPSQDIPPSSPPKFKAGAILAILALVIALPVLVKSVRTRQLTSGKAALSTPTPLPSPVPVPPISWETNYARLKATYAYLQVKDQMFYGIPDQGTSITVYSQPPTTQNPNFTTLETSWIEHGIKMRILIQFNKTTDSWWASDLALYMDDRKMSGQSGVFFKTNLGRPYFQKNLDVQDNGLHLFAQLFELQAFTSPTPIPSPTPTPTPAPIPISLLKNSSFEIDLDNNKIPDQWLAKNLKNTDGLRKAFAHQGKLSFMFSPLTSSTAPKKQLYQSLPLLGSANEALTLGLWSMTQDSVSIGKVAAVITVNYTNGTSDSTSAVLPRFVHKWTQRVVRLVTSKPYNSIKVNLTSSNQSSEFLLDDMSLTSVKSAFAKGLKTTPSDLTTTELAEFK